MEGGDVREVIMGTTPNVEGDATALVVAERLAGLPVGPAMLAGCFAGGAAAECAEQRRATQRGEHGAHRIDVRTGLFLEGGES